VCRSRGKRNLATVSASLLAATSLLKNGDQRPPPLDERVAQR
jgi:hypothetical protein